MSLQVIKNQFESHKGEFVITANWDVKRLVGLIEDEDDYYWLFYDGITFEYHSCLLPFIVLSGKIDFKDYSELIRLSKLNHEDQPSSYTRDEITHVEISLANEHMNNMESSIKDKIISGIFWELK